MPINYNHTIIAECSWMAEYIVQVEEMHYKNNNVLILLMTMSFKYLFKCVYRWSMISIF